MNDCFLNKDLNNKTCKFLKKCKTGRERNPITNRCIKTKKKTLLKELSLKDSLKELSLKDSLKKLSLKDQLESINSFEINFKDDNLKQRTRKEPLSSGDIKSTLNSIDSIDSIKNINNIRVFPKNGELINENNKSYILFKDGGTGIMLANNIFDKDKKIKILNKKNMFKYKQPPIGWYASEKYDGVRAIWTGKELIARPLKKDGVLKAKVFSYVPDWFINMLPKDVSFDGEIWMGRGNFNIISGISNMKIGKHNKEKIDSIWKKIKYMVFDIPSIDDIYDKRYNFLQYTINKINSKYSEGGYSNIMLSNHTIIESNNKLIELYKTYTTNGAEGIIIREPSSLYESKRSELLLKMKIHEDAEAKVIGYNLGKGRLKNMLGSLKCEFKNKKIFNIGTGLNDITREEFNKLGSIYYIPIGSIVNFAYMEISKDGIPRHPVFRGLRSDVDFLYL